MPTRFKIAPKLISFPKNPSAAAALITLIKPSPFPNNKVAKNNPMTLAINPTNNSNKNFFFNHLNSKYLNFEYNDVLLNQIEQELQKHNHVLKPIHQYLRHDLNLQIFQ